VTQRVIFAEGCREIDSPVTGRRYYARGGGGGYAQGGSFDMGETDAKLAVRMGGAIASLAGGTRRALGWRCPRCGFGSFLKRCGRCGGECERE
jgi:hypothetical protein